MSREEINQKLNELTDEELDAYAKRGKSIYNREYRKRKAEECRRAQKRSYAKIALQAEAQEGGNDD